MATNSVLIVLMPNGRRETVKVTPNTSILQVLEDVCRKQGFNAIEYDLKHYNRIVEPANSVRFSGLPNKATLEMVQTSKPRQETSINLGLQLESGKRLMHPFYAQNTLWEIIKHWEATGEPVLPNSSTSDTGSIQPVCVYMRQEIVGEEQLQTRTLRSLGLTHGSACIRLLHRSVDQLGYQANVSAPLFRPSVTKVEEENEPVTISLSPKPQAIVKPHGQDPVQTTHHDNSNTAHHFKVPSQQTGVVPSEVSGGKKRPLSVSPIPMDTEESSPVIVPMETPTFPLDLSTPPTPISIPVELKPRISVEGALHILGEHDAVLYHADDVRQPSVVSIPESFFDVTRADVESIWRDLRIKSRELADSPLTTSLTRNQEREATILKNLQQYPVTVLRVRFQNRYVLQGTFRGIDTVGAVMNMVKTYLVNPDIDFYLFTSPPKIILEPEQRLVEQGLVGTAVIYFGSCQNQDNYINPEVYTKLSCPDAIYDFLQNMDKREKPHIDPISMSNNQKTNDIISNQQPGPSTMKPPPVPRPKNSDTSGRVPKWFKP